MRQNYVQIRATIEGDATLAVHFVNVKSDTKAEDTPVSDAAIQAIEDYFNIDAPSWRDVPVSEFAAYLDLNGLTEKVRVASVSDLDLNVKEIAGTVSRIAGLTSAVQTLEISNPDKRVKIKNMMDTLVAASVWSQVEADGVFDLARTTEPMYKQYGGKVGRGIILLLKSGRA